MARGYDNDWMTTFVYNQDIRSYLFNNLLFSVVKNGVYNADISIGSGTSGGSALEVTIKKGTTLIFSNDYIQNPTSKRYERNFGENTNRESVVNVSVVKCVARQDNTSTFNVGTSNTTGAQILTLDDTKKPLYIIAYIKYYSEQSTENVVPRFGLFTKVDSDTNSENSYFKSVYADSDISITEGSTVDPSLSTATSTMYLILGELLPTSSTDSYTAIDEDWYKKHTFTCKGLPEYRYPMVSSKSIPSSDVLIKYNTETSLPTLFVDWEKVLIKGDYYNKEVDWRYTYSLDESSFNPSNASMLDSDTLALEDSEYALANNADTLVADFIFAQVNNNLNNEETSNSSDLLYSLNFANASESLPLFTYRYIGTYNSQLYNLKQYTTDESNRYSLWLDKGKTNKERLLAFLENRGIMKKVINNIRQRKLVEGYNSVIPVAVIFRDLKCGDAFSTQTNINPANVLCLLDLASENKDVNRIDSTVADVYNVVSVID